MRNRNTLFKCMLNKLLEFYLNFNTSVLIYKFKFVVRPPKYLVDEKFGDAILAKSRNNIHCV